jgi:hypothetical protein
LRKLSAPKEKSRRLSRDFFEFTGIQLGSAALSDVVVLFVLALAALFLLILLAGLLAALLAAALLTLTSLAALLAALTGLSALLSRLATLATLLFVFLHIVCHEIVLPLNARLGA